MGIWFCCNSISGNHIHTILSCHDNKILIWQAQFYSNHLIAMWTEPNWNSHEIEKENWLFTSSREQVWKQIPATKQTYGGTNLQGWQPF